MVIIIINWIGRLNKLYPSHNNIKFSIISLKLNNCKQLVQAISSSNNNYQKHSMRRLITLIILIFHFDYRLKWFTPELYTHTHTYTERIKKAIWCRSNQLTISEIKLKAFCFQYSTHIFLFVDKFPSYLYSRRDAKKKSNKNILNRTFKPTER